MAFPIQRIVSPPLEIQVADDPINLVDRCDSIPLHAFPLPLPSDNREKACSDVGDDEIEPALYKKVIYIPDTTGRSSRGRGKRASNYVNKESPSPSAPLDCCEWLPREIREEQRNERGEDGRSSCTEKVWHHWYSKHKAWECLANYKREWECCFKFEVTVAFHYLFWENIVWGILMGAWLEQQTSGRVGSVEVFSSNLLCGTAFVLLGGHASLIAGVTAPVVIFMIAVSDAADRLSIEFLPWMGWVGIWSSVVLMILSALGACRYIATTITSFTWEAIQIFVGMTFIWNAVEEMARFFSSHMSLDSSMLSLWLATSSFVTAAFLSQAGGFRLLNRKLCRIVGNCALPMALLLFTGMAFLPKLRHPQLQRVCFPTAGFRTDGIPELGSSVRLKSVPIWAVFLAIIPGSLLASMIFLDHNGASLLIQDKANLNVNGSSSGSWDVFIIALLVLICGILGLPFCYGLICQSLKHAHLLTRYENSDPGYRQRCPNEIKGQRISGLIASLLSGLPLVPGSNLIMGKIPFAVVVGLFLEVALETFRNLHSVEYIKVILTDPSWHPIPSISAVRQYSFIQFACTIIIFATSKTPAALVFPLFFLLMMWLRHCPLSGVFAIQGLDKLDLKLLNDNSRTDMTDIMIVSQLGTFIRPPFPSNKRNIRVRGKHTECESPLPWRSPTTVAAASTRRLKERSLRRKKRKRPTSINEPNQQGIHSDLHGVALPFACRYELKNSSAATKQPSSSTIGRRFLKRKKNSPIQMHSNLLYDPGWDGPPPLNIASQVDCTPGEQLYDGDVTENAETRITMKMKPSKQRGVGTYDISTFDSSPHPPSSPSCCSSFSQQDRRHCFPQNLSDTGSSKEEDGVDAAGFKALPAPSKRIHNAYPSNPIMKTTREATIKHSNTNSRRSRNERKRVILNQSIWPSNKSMPSIK